MRRWLAGITRMAAISLIAAFSLPAMGQAEPYPAAAALVASPGGTTYHVDPAKGDDTRDGTKPDTAWKSFVRVNGLKLAAGDRVLVAPGVHELSLTPHAAGTAEKPVVIRFLRGVHEFAVGRSLRRPWHISNASDAPDVPKPMAILVEDSRHLQFEGAGPAGKDRSLLLMGGRMIEFVNSHSQDIGYRGLAFDLKRPTVSEFRVEEVAADSAVIRIAEGSTFAIDGGKFRWTGDIGSGGVMVQQAIPEEGRAWRVGIDWDPFSTATATSVGEGKVRLVWDKGNFGMTKGRQFQFRHIFRDSAGGFNQRCKNISFRDCTFHALTNMGIISQFTENIAFQRVEFVPPPGTIRTCPCWADALHFSGCKGRLTVEDCRFSGLQDDAINVHGTHLRIIGKTTDNQLHLRFMQPQTYGFAAFMPGDEIAVISHASLRELPDNPRRKVTAIEPKAGSNGKDWLLTLDGPAPAFGTDDVVDNVTWYPELIAKNNRVEMASCRGFLITTRGKSLVEGNTFHRCTMPGILIEDDANGWFESGPIRDLTVRDNRFIGCGIEISPKTRTPEQPVHENVRLLENQFDGGGISVHSVGGLTLRGNKFTGKEAISLHHCTDVSR
ncbi:right-handed parallel beta-helix repeat-containing protein [Luteolibacter arcticus]|uniref:Right-handed parallel beta-helix repeat-containing protein n=1 Tax=Luteolibacter arcticus TaxID=1581411 RepID=A0ABT3GS72_9BACT|nr:right-handed parallel beta-helix repeat-containing protein [Luteolibacter arcticus]MCW1926382.1 right-handed parallel beta-helix repeat-containing protein [Luteolibacter arcticus]